MKRVLILVSEIFGIGGIQQYNRNLFTALEHEFKKTEFTALSFHDLRKNHSRRRWHNIDLCFYGQVKPKFVKKICYFMKVLSLVLAKRPLFLICFHIDLAPIALFLKKIFNLQYAVIALGIDVWDIKDSLKYSALKDASLILSISRHTKERMVLKGIASEKIEILPCAINTSLFHRKPRNVNLARRMGLENKKILLTVGRMSSKERYKGHDMVLEVLQRLGKDYVSLIIGTGDDLTRLKEKAKALGVIDKVRFIGNVKRNELVDYYNLSDCFIMPSKGEGFGIVFLEAMACGKPVVGGNKDGTREPLLDGKLGFMVDPDNIDEILSTIDLVCTTGEQRTDPDYLRKGVESNFGKDVFSKKVKNIFERFC